MMAGSGAPVGILEAGKVRRGKWLVSKDDWLVELPDGDAGAKQKAGGNAAQSAGHSACEFGCGAGRDRGVP